MEEQRLSFALMLRALIIVSATQEERFSSSIRCNPYGTGLTPVKVSIRTSTVDWIS